jgi:hypothetical protein
MRRSPAMTDEKPAPITPASDEEIVHYETWIKHGPLSRPHLSYLGVVPRLIARIRAEQDGRTKDRKLCIRRVAEVTRECNANAERILELEAEVARLREALKAIGALSAGWDEDGSLGPKEPLSWESVGRMSLDYARAALGEKR